MYELILKITLSGGLISILLGFIMLSIRYSAIPKKLAIAIVSVFFLASSISIFGTITLIWIR
jgi:hypothetical protein